MAAPPAKVGANKVPEMIQKIAAAKATGKFTYQAGRMDRAVNLAFGLGLLFAFTQVGQGIHQMAYGYGKKDGF